MRRCILSLGLCACIAACAESSNGDLEVIAVDYVPLIDFTPTYSAYDGVHEYKLTFSLATTAGLDLSTLRWTVDDAFVQREDFDELPGGLLLTTKKPGVTTVYVSVKLDNGLLRKQPTTLTITKADPDEWELGDKRYSRAVPNDFGGPRKATAFCDLSAAELARIPEDNSCASCHDSDSSLSKGLTPIQLEGRSDDELIAAFTRGQRYNSWPSPFFKQLANPDCVFRAFHTWAISDEDTRGLLWKLRSLEPRR